MIQGLRTVIYQVPDLEAAKAWYSGVLGIAPYFDQPFYVGFEVGGFEFGLDPDMTGAGAAGASSRTGASRMRPRSTRACSPSAPARTRTSPTSEKGSGSPS